MQTKMQLFKMLKFLNYYDSSQISLDYLHNHCTCMFEQCQMFYNGTSFRFGILKIHWFLWIFLLDSTCNWWSQLFLKIKKIWLKICFSLLNLNMNEYFSKLILQRGYHVCETLSRFQIDDMFYFGLFL